MDKVVASCAAAVRDIPSGASLAVGGFGLNGVPIHLIEALFRQGATDRSSTWDFRLARRGRSRR
jgi:3-oxoacid CoA-transferase subunit A